VLGVAGGDAVPGDDHGLSGHPDRLPAASHGDGVHPER
jgi:hypothetical protein